MCCWLYPRTKEGQLGWEVFGGELVVFGGELVVLGRELVVFGGELVVFGGELVVFGGELVVFGEELVVFEGVVSVLAGDWGICGELGCLWGVCVGVIGVLGVRKDAHRMSVVDVRVTEIW